MFELSIAFKYLIPKRKQLSVSLIALMSVGVISLVTWLLILFLSITEGIEKSWLEKLTTINAPIRITPTEAYYNSYYYQVDGQALASDYTLKSLGDKALADESDPYSPEWDRELPHYISEKHLDRMHQFVDPVKRAYAILEENKDVQFQDYEMSGGLIRLQMVRPGAIGDVQSYLTQVSYLASYSEKNPKISELLIQPTVADLNHLVYMSRFSSESSAEDAPTLTSHAEDEQRTDKLSHLMKAVQIERVETSPYGWRLPRHLIPEGEQLQARANRVGDEIVSVTIESPPKGDEGSLRHVGGQFYFAPRDGATIRLSPDVPFVVGESIALNVTRTVSGKTPYIEVEGEIQGVTIAGATSMHGLSITEGRNNSSRPWAPLSVDTSSLPEEPNGTSGVLLPLPFQKGGVLLGDRGYISYPASTASSVQEQRLPIFVAGFYDPGIMSVGARAIFVKKEIAHAINQANQSHTFDPELTNGLHVWTKDLKNVEAIKAQIMSAFEEAEIANYWKVSTFREYDFAQDLLNQFQSDKTLFSLVGAIILLVACCNIVSLLTLLVNDKKREIGILLSLGASKHSLALIFGTCGICLGVLSCMLGIVASAVTLHNIDAIVAIISKVQGHAAFNPAFFGSKLPNEMSSAALKFILIAGPIIAVLSGLIPALKAARLSPSEILRSE